VVILLMHYERLVPEALHSISSATINRYYKHCMRIFIAYREGIQYNTKDFRERVYSSHQQVVDKSKW
jgi:hypothetical protein